MGKTELDFRLYLTNEKHPHSRGEDLYHYDVTLQVEETPPLAWGRLMLDYDFIDFSGNTPTRVGKTLIYINLYSVFEKHPHSRGEDKLSAPTL